MSELDLAHSLLRDQKLPSLPPPPLPPKSPSSDVSDTTQPLNPESLTPAIRLPPTPTTSITPLNPSSPDAKPKKSNPLNDLIETEKIYVDNLTGIIRKVAAAWSRSNLPPPDLDVMFRSIEGVYKANRSLHSKLKDIGTNPSSPKALGDLLMQWIDDLNGPYTTYCTRYRCGFDTWGPVQSNARLADILSNFSMSNPPPSTSMVSNTSDPPTWTLDDLFLLPKARLRYYKKLYGRLLKSTAPGRSDHRLLVGALDSLDKLLDTLDSRASIKVGEATSPTSVEPEDEVVIDLRTQSVISGQDRQSSDPRASTDRAPGSDNGSNRGSSVSEGERLSRETSSTPAGRTSSAIPVTDLERRLATDQTLDIFTMKPKVVRLQMTPPGLTYTRELRLSVDVIIRLTSQATGIEVVHSRGHIFLLSDLFLVCERMTPEERLQQGSGGPDMWLRYPPLAGKVLRVAEVPDDVLQVAIMRKETLILQAETKEVRDFLLVQFKECIEFAGSVSPVSKQPPPPLPPLSGMMRATTGAPQTPPGNFNDSSKQQASPPSVIQRHESLGGPIPRLETRDMESPPAVHVPPEVLFPEGQMRQGAQRVPSIRDPMPDPMMSRQLSTQQTASVPSSFSPGQVIPPGRTSSVGPQDYMRPGPGLPLNPASGLPGPAFQPQYRPNQLFSPNRQNPHGPHPLPPGHPSRPPSEPFMQDGLRKSLSTHSLMSQYSQHERLTQAPPIPSFPGGHPPNTNFIPRSSSYSNLHAPQPRPLLPSAQFASRIVSTAAPSFDEPSPPNSPVEETPRPAGPVTSTISAQMKCKVFLQQQHAQWKSLGAAKLKLYRQDPTNIKQLVVEAENKDKSILISTIVLTDGVERVGKTGVAIELSDKGTRTGIVYMIQLRNEKSAGGLFDSLLAGSDRASRG